MAKIHILGSGTPFPGTDRFGSGYLIDIGDDRILFDCGPATTQKLARAGYSPVDVSAVFLTHHHYDHMIDLPCLLMVRWDHQTPETPILRVFGPPATEELVDEMVGRHGFLRRDIIARSEHPSSQRVYQKRGGTLPRPWPEWKAGDLAAGDKVDGGGWVVTTARAAHVQPFHESLAYRIETPTSSVVVTGDTARCPEVTELARNADVMLCCCWDHHDGAEQIDECVAEGMTGNMCGPEDAALMAAEAGVRRLVLVHSTQSISQPASAARAIDVTREAFDGPVTFAYEGFELDF